MRRWRLTLWSRMSGLAGMANAGNLDQRITFQTETLTPDGMGGNTAVWGSVVDTPEVWAEVIPLSGRELRQEGGDAAVAEYRFTVRYRTDVSENDRILWEGVTYNIRRVERTSQRKLFTVFIAERGVST